MIHGRASGAICQGGLRSPAAGAGLRIAALAALGALAACATIVPLERAKGPEPTAAWLAGGWVLRGERCDSDAGIVYRQDGSWVSQDSSGRWRLRKRRIELTLGAGAGAASRPSFVDEIEVRGPDEFVARRAGRPDRDFIRCRPHHRRG